MSIFNLIALGAVGFSMFGFSWLICFAEELLK